MAVTNPTQHGRRRYRVRHLTEYSYSAEVTASYSRGILKMRETPWQRVSDQEVSVDPAPEVCTEQLDIFDNHGYYVEVLTPHTRLAVQKTGVVEVDWPLVDLDELDELTVAGAAELVRTDPGVDLAELGIYLLPSPHVELSAPVRAFAQTLLPPGLGTGSALARLTHAIHDDFRYSKSATTTRTTLPELLSLRAGVCQDFAHLAVACFRSVGLPARYVSGYIETAPTAGKVRLTGSDASHAWASVWIPGHGWIDIDPTNDHLADSRYIVSAWGRDFRDVSPLRGVIFTDSHTSSLKVGVDVIRLDA